MAKDPSSGEDRALLIVEDSPADRLIIERAIEEAQLKCEFRMVNDGQQALNYLNGLGDYADRDAYPLPTLLFLDINMPVMNGKETLKAIRAHERFFGLPVIMLSTSDHDNDINVCYKLGANAFITKPVSLDSFIRTLIKVDEFWLKLATLPPRMKQ